MNRTPCIDDAMRTATPTKKWRFMVERLATMRLTTSFGCVYAHARAVPSEKYPDPSSTRILFAGRIRRRGAQCRSGNLLGNRRGLCWGLSSFPCSFFICFYVSLFHRFPYVRRRARTAFEFERNIETWKHVSPRAISCSQAGRIPWDATWSCTSGW